MLTRDLERAVTWGGRAIELAERLGETEILVHALNNVGTAEAAERLGGGLVAAARKASRWHSTTGSRNTSARAYTNLAASTVERHEYALAESYLAAGIGYCREHDLDSWRCT